MRLKGLDRRWIMAVARLERTAVAPPRPFIANNPITPPHYKGPVPFSGTGLHDQHSLRIPMTFTAQSSYVRGGPVLIACSDMPQCALSARTGLLGIALVVLKRHVRRTSSETRRVTRSIRFIGSNGSCWVREISDISVVPWSSTPSPQIGEYPGLFNKMTGEPHDLKNRP